MTWRDKEFKRQHKFRKPQEIDAIVEQAYSNLEDDPDLIRELQWKRDDPIGYAAFGKALDRYLDAEDDFECACTQAEERRAERRMAQAWGDMWDNNPVGSSVLLEEGRADV